MKLWHCNGSRSLRALWTLEELGLDYEIETMPFPPRVRHKQFLDVNSLGTVPFFVDGETEMTESSAICVYLAERYDGAHLLVDKTNAQYGAFLNWVFQSDATYTFPQTLYIRYSLLDPDPQKQAVGEDYRKWFKARLRWLDAHLLSREYLCDQRFTIADITVGYALFLGATLGFDKEYEPQTKAYLERLCSRPAFARANAIGEPLSFS